MLSSHMCIQAMPPAQATTFQPHWHTVICSLQKHGPNQVPRMSRDVYTSAGLTLPRAHTTSQRRVMTIQSLVHHLHPHMLLRHLEGLGRFTLMHLCLGNTAFTQIYLAHRFLELMNHVPVVEALLTLKSHTPMPVPGFQPLHEIQPPCMGWVRYLCI